MHALIFSFFVTFAYSADDLRQKISSMKVHKMTAAVVQTKSSPYFLKPLISHIDLTYTPKEIRWHMKDPVDSLAILTEDSLTLIQDKTTQYLKASSDPKVGAIVKMIHAIIKLDLPQIEKDFELTFTTDSVKAHARSKPQSAAGSLVTSLEIVFKTTVDKNLIPSVVNLIIGEEKNYLIFNDVHLE